MEQMEMYKDTKAYQKTVRTYVDNALGPWLATLQQSLLIDVRGMSGEEFDDAVKLKYATYKVPHLALELIQTLVLLDRAFGNVLQRLLEPLLEPLLSSLENIYPYFEQSLSTSPTPQLNRYIISLFGILQIVLRSEAFDTDSPNSEERTVHGTSLDQILFMQCLKFAQVSDDAANEFVEDPVSTIEDSPETLNRVAVRTAILSCAMEVTRRPSHLTVAFQDIVRRALVTCPRRKVPVL